MGFVTNVRYGVWSSLWRRSERLRENFLHWRRKIREGCSKVMLFCVVSYELACSMRPEWSSITCWVCESKISWRGVFKLKYLSLVWRRVFITLVCWSDRDTYGKLLRNLIFFVTTQWFDVLWVFSIAYLVAGGNGWLIVVTFELFQRTAIRSYVIENCPVPKSWRFFQFTRGVLDIVWTLDELVRDK